MSEKPLLTISLLSSGRKDTIERCLASLAPFREQLETETIVVDTDPSHDAGVHAVLEKYTDEIIPFEWCNDFSAARNIGVDAASGEWFLYVDDDEWFVDAQPLVDFLKSGEQAECDRINYIVRNYRNGEQSVYGDAWVTRLFKLDGHTRFAGKVHEYIAPDYGKIKNIGALAGHSGYIFRNEEEREAHAERNTALLRRMMEEEPREVRWVLQLMMEYGDRNDLENELALARKGYAMMAEAEGYRYACVRGLFAATAVRTLFEENKYRDCIDEYKKLYAEKKPFGSIPPAYISHLLALAFYRLSRTEEAEHRCLAYWAAYDELHDAPTGYVEEYTYTLMATFEEPIYSLMAELYVRLEAGKQGDEEDEHFAGRIRDFWEKEKSRGVIQGFLLEWRPSEEGGNAGSEQGNIPAVSGMTDQSAAYWRLTEALATAEGLLPQPLDVKIIWDDHIGVRDHMKDYFKTMFSVTNPLLLDPSLWRIGLRRGAVLDERIAEIPMERWQACVEEFVHGTSFVHARQMADILDNAYLGMPDERYRYFTDRLSGEL